MNLTELLQNPLADEEIEKADRWVKEGSGWVHDADAAIARAAGLKVAEGILATIEEEERRLWQLPEGIGVSEGQAYTDIAKWIKGAIEAARSEA